MTTIRARAKVNLRLRVLGRRADGYHELSTLFDRISLADTIELSPAASIMLACDAPGLPGGVQNLAWRAAAAALGAAKDARGVAIRLSKGVPAGAGLGGGSADGAAVLVGTDRLLGLKLGEPMLLSIGRALGADVPFFVHAHLRDEESAGSGRMAFGRGVGEVLAPVLRPPPLHYVLVNPGFEVSTALVFREGNFGPLAEDGTDAAKAPETLDDVLGLLQNDLEAVTAGMHREIGEMLAALREEGALGARMSGSGPTVFGIFASESAASEAADRLRRRMPETKVFVARGE